MSPTGRVPLRARSRSILIAGLNEGQITSSIGLLSSYFYIYSKLRAQARPQTASSNVFPFRQAAAQQGCRTFLPDLIRRGNDPGFQMVSMVL